MAERNTPVVGQIRTKKPIGDTVLDKSIGEMQEVWKAGEEAEIGKNKKATGLLGAKEKLQQFTGRLGGDLVLRRTMIGTGSAKTGAARSGLGGTL
jgi:hypothetical protein